MAEINVERKQSHTGFWIAAALIVLILVVWWTLRSDPADDVLGAVTDSSAVVAPIGGMATDSAPPAAGAFLRWSEEAGADTTMSLDHQYTVTGIRHLTDALQAIAGSAQAAAVGEELRLLRSRADTLQQNPESTRHADRVRVMFRSLSGLMAAMQQERFPDMADEVKAVNDAAEAVRADRLLLDQRAQVKDFFDRSAVVVRQMAGPR